MAVPIRATWQANGMDRWRSGAAQLKSVPHDRSRRSRGWGKPDLRLGFDLEPFGRKANVELPRAEQFLRLWTLKEAFVKATGEGLATDLSSFWFDLSALRIRFPEGSPEPSNEWLLEQRALGQFVAALAMHRGSNCSIAVRWNEIEAGDLLSGRIASDLAQNDRGVDAAEGEVV